MVSLRQLLLLLQVLVKLRLLREGNCINTLQIVILLLAQPVSRGIFSDLETLDPVGRGQVGPSAEIDQIPAAIGRGEPVLGDLVLDELLLEGIVSEKLECFGLGQQNPFVLLLLLSVSSDLLLDAFEIRLRDSVVSDEGIIEETLVERRTVAQPSPVKVLQALAEQMGTRMPENLLSNLVIEREQLKETVSFQRTSQIAQLKFTFRGSVLLCFS